MTLIYRVLIDVEDGPVTPTRRLLIGHAIARVLYLATESDIEGAETLDSSLGSITVEEVSDNAK